MKVQLIKRPSKHYKQITNEAFKCPFCGEIRIHNLLTDYGIECYEVTWCRIFPRLIKLTQRRFKCYICKAEWETKCIKEKVKL